MLKKYIYEFNGRIWVDADNQAQAEELISGKELDYYVINENVYGVDEYFVAFDMIEREKDWGCFYHPVHDLEEYSKFKERLCKYGGIFKTYLHGKVDKDELINRLKEDDNEINANDCGTFKEFQAYDLIGAILKTVRHYSVE